VCGQPLLQVALLHAAATAQQVYMEKGGESAVTLAAACSSAERSESTAGLSQLQLQQQQQKQRQKLRSSASSNSSSSRGRSEVWAVQQHHTRLLAAALGGLQADEQRTSNPTQHAAQQHA
jgi:hypothetical protein